MTKVAINGFGRIGRVASKIIIDKHPELELVAVNDLADPVTLTHLFKHDTVYGTYDHDVRIEDGSLLIGKKKIALFSEKDPENLPWKEMGIEIVLECTGFFRDCSGAEKHIRAGARKVIISAPSKEPENIPSYVMGVNEEKLSEEDYQVIDIGSCTTNCLAPVLKILNDTYGVEKGFMTTSHSYTSSQNLVDLNHSDLRRARAAAVNIVPTTTGAAKAIGRVMPELEGKVDGMSLRVPIPVVSIMDLVCELKKEVSVNDLKELFSKKSQEEKYEGILKLEETPLVSSDYVGSSFSAIVDSPFIMADGKLVKIMAWYDNEWGYSCRLADTAGIIAKNWKLKEEFK